jgi:membrane protein YqaA with SNARE-associated domain
MPQDLRKTSSPRRYRARFASLWGVLGLETIVIIALVAGVLWFVNSRTDRGVTSMLGNPQLWVLVVAVSALGTLGNLGLYYLGGRGAEAVFARFPYLEGERWERIGGYYRRWGGRILLFSAIPTLGTLLTTAAGAYGVKRRVFLLWVFSSKALRNWLLLLLFYGAFRSV